MGTHLSQITEKRVLKPPRIAIHGRGGVGKTSFAASVPGVLFMPLEDGLGLHDVPALPQPKSYVEVVNMLAELHNEEHPYKALAIDTIDHLEPLVWEHVCQEQSKGNKKYASIEDFGYGKGYLFADPPWIEFYHRLNALRDRGMTILVLCHNESKIVDDPMVGPYERVAPKLHKRANALLYEWSDICGYLDVERSARTREGAKGRETQTAMVIGGRVLYLEDQGAFVAKNRFGIGDALIRIPKDNPYQALRTELKKALGDATKKEAA